MGRTNSGHYFALIVNALSRPRFDDDFGAAQYRANHDFGQSIGQKGFFLPRPALLAAANHTSPKFFLYAEPVAAQILPDACEFPLAGRQKTHYIALTQGCGRSSGVEHNLAKVRVGRSNRLARSIGSQ
jgi:hypothetical protein